MSKYKDRGIIKWLPFDSLIGYHDLISDLKYRLGKKDKPVLSDDQLDVMDKTLKLSLSSQEDICIAYYEDGYIKQTVGKVKHIDILKRQLTLDDNVIYLMDNILNIEK